MPSAPLNSTESIASHHVLVTTYLDALFSRKIVAAREVHPRYETLWSEIARVSSRGKRLRPHMVLMAYEAFGGSESSGIVPAAAACELLHISMLVHDDIIDRDLLRHGEPTIQAAYEMRYAHEIPNADDRRHNAIAAALLAGDLLLSEARSLITKSSGDDDAISQAGYAFDQAVFEVAGGELLDVESSSASRGAVDALTIMTYKTASYSFVAPLIIGAILAGASLSQQKALRSFAVNLGIAYQLTDDILGVFGNTSETGKPNDGDIREGKATYLIERFYARASATDAASFERSYGNKLATQAACDQVRTLLTSSGALAETQHNVHLHTVRARNDLDSVQLSPEARAGFEALITKSTDRSS